LSDIGYQDGIEAFEQWYRKLSTSIDAHNKWVADFAAWNKLPDEIKQDTDLPNPPLFPKIPLEGPLYVEADQSTWPWPKKFFDNTMRKLKDDHDASNATPEPEPTPEPPIPTPKNIAPRTFNKQGGSDARFCVKDLPRNPQGNPYDEFTTYDNNGLDVVGGRDPDRQVPGLRGAREMDQYGPCDLYPPLTQWPPESYLR
jgi:hypothetical protein